MRLLLALVSVLMVTIFASSAEARHRHHRHYHRTAVVQQPAFQPMWFGQFNTPVVKRERASRHVAARDSYAYAFQPSQPAPVAPSARRPAVSMGSSGLVERARQYMGMTAGQIGLRRNLWCAAFMNYITGGGTGSDLAKSYLSKPHVGPQVGAIAVLSRGRGGHVGVVSGFDDGGNPIIVSGNHGHRVGEGVYSKHRVIAYVSA